MTLVNAKPVRGRNLSVQIRRPKERRSRSQGATRALDVLELFGTLRRPLRAVEVARELNAHPSTTNQLLKTMVDSGHLAFSARDKSYLPTPRLARFGAWIVDAYGTCGGTQDLAAQLQARTGMLVTISSPNDLFMQVVEIAMPVGWTGERGLRVSLFGSAVGSAYLSKLPEAEVIRLAERARIPKEQLPSLACDLNTIRLAGYADGAIDASPYWSIAVPLAGQKLNVPLVLGLAGPTEEVLARSFEIVELMKDAARRFAAPVSENR